MIEFMRPNEKKAIQKHPDPASSRILFQFICKRQMGIGHHKMHSAVKSSFCTALKFAVTLTMAVFNIISICFRA